MNPRLTLFCVAAFSIGVISTAHAQGRTGCQSPQPPSIGVAVGRSSPYLEPAADIIGAEPVGSVSVGGGAELAGRADLPVTGPLRVRLEGAASRWDVRRTLYTPGGAYYVSDESSIGSMTAKRFVALVGIRTGRAPVCAHVSAGGGLYSIGFRNASLRRPGFAVAAGVELPTDSHGAVQLDATVHMVATRDGSPITNSSTVPTLSLVAGWAYRF